MSGIVGSKLNIRGSGRVAKLGTDGQVLTSSGAGKPANYEAGATSYDDDAVRDDIATLALHQATDANAAKYNLVNTNVDQYEDSTGVASFTDCARNEAGEYVSTAVSSPTGDDNTVILLHMEDTGLTDSSQNAITTTLNGDTARSSAQAKFGTYSAHFDGTGDYLSLPDINANDPEVTTPTTGVFTIDCWINQTSRSASDRFFCFGNDGTPAGGTSPVGLAMSYNAATTINMFNTAGSNVFTYPSVDFGTWHHFAVMRASNGTTYNWYDGVNKGSGTGAPGSANIVGADGTVFLAARSGSTAEYFTGYIDEFRFSNNERYTGGVAFTPPTAAYTTDSFSATGNYVSTATTANASVTSMGMVITYKNAYGTNTLNTDIVAEVSADSGSNYTTCVLEAAGTFSTGILQAVANDVTVTAGTGIQYRISFANQSSESKEAYIYGASLMY